MRAQSASWDLVPHQKAIPGERLKIAQSLVGPLRVLLLMFECPCRTPPLSLTPRFSEVWTRLSSVPTASAVSPQRVLLVGQGETAERFAKALSTTPS
jgi:hypothetical protein